VIALPDDRRAHAGAQDGAWAWYAGTSRSRVQHHRGRPDTAEQSLRKPRKLPQISFHGLRHSHVSALIAGGIGVLTVSRRIGHASPVVTMKVYAHLFSETDKTAAKAIEAVLRTGKER
jgi:integrase